MRKFIFLIIWFIPVVIHSGWIYQGPRGKAYQILPTSDGGFIASGFTYSKLYSTNYAYLLKLNAYGDSLWMKLYGSQFFIQESKDFIATSDFGYLIAGNITRYYEKSISNIYLVKTDSSGNFIWSKSLGEDNIKEEALAVIQAYDGNYVIAGVKNSSNSIWDNAFLLKVDATGDTLWTRTYGVDTLNDYFVDILETEDRGFIICGYSSKAFYSTIQLMKTDSLGDSVWARTLIEGGISHATAIREVPGNGYVVLGYTSKFSGTDDIFVIRTDYQGNTRWSQVYENGIKDKGYSIDLTPDGGFVVVGSTEISYAEYDADVYVMKIDSFGHKLWERTFGFGGKQDEGIDIKLTAGNDFIISGFYNYAPWYKYEKIFVLRTDSLGVAVEENVFSSPHQNYFSVLPLNNHQVQIRFSLVQPGQVRVEVYDLSGRWIDTPGEGFYPAGEHCIYWLVPRPGVYFFRISSDNLNQTAKLATWR